MRKKISILLIFCFIFSFTFNNVNAEENVDTIIKKYGLTKIDESEVPDGIIPVKIESEEELKTYLEKEERNLSASVNFTKPNLTDIRKNLLATTSGMRTVDVKMGAKIPIGMTLTLLANIDYYSSGSFHSIEKVNFERMSLTGYTISNSIDNIKTLSKRYNNGTIFVSGYATYKTYFLLKGTWVLDNSDIVMKYNYALGKGFSNVVMTRDGENMIRAY